MNIVVLISGGGTNLQAIIDSINKNKLDASISLVISSREDAYGLVRANNSGIKNICIKDENKILDYILNLEEDIDLIVLAGYLKKLPEDLVNRFENKIINIHPSLIPKYSGKGFYGMRVHEAVINSNEEYSGATVHFVDKNYDTGKIIIQEKVEVLKTDTKERLQKKVLDIEHRILIEAIKIVGGLNEKSSN